MRETFLYTKPYFTTFVSPLYGFFTYLNIYRKMEKLLHAYEGMDLVVLAVLLITLLLLQSVKRKQKLLAHVHISCSYILSKLVSCTSRHSRISTQVRLCDPQIACLAPCHLFYTSAVLLSSGLFTNTTGVGICIEIFLIPRRLSDFSILWFPNPICM